MNFGSMIPWRDRSQVSAPRDDWFDPIVAFKRQVDRMFNDFFSGQPGRGLAEWRGISPAVDVSETDKELVVAAEMPGLDEKDFEVTLTGDLLTIKGEKKVESERKDGNGHQMERRFGSFARSLRLPFEVKDEKIGATYDKGILTVRIPKPAEAQQPVRRIEVKKASH